MQAIGLGETGTDHDEGSSFQAVSGLLSFNISQRYTTSQTGNLFDLLCLPGRLNAVVNIKVQPPIANHWEWWFISQEAGTYQVLTHSWRCCLVCKLVRKPAAIGHNAGRVQADMEAKRASKHAHNNTLYFSRS
jgi:hypothetical protein